MNITGTKWYVQIEDDNGNIARFDGELGSDGFYADADSVQWVRHKGEATDKDRIDLIYRATQYGKNSDIKILFFHADNKVMFETELGLKTEVYWSKTYLVDVFVMVFSLIFPAVLVAMLDVASMMFSTVFTIITVLLASPFLVWGFLICRFRVTAEGNVITVIPGAGRKYTFPMDEITGIVRKTKLDSGWEEIEKIRIQTKTKHISLNDNMTGIRDMDAYLMRHTDAGKIITKQKH